MASPNRRSRSLASLLRIGAVLVLVAAGWLLRPGDQVDPARLDPETVERDSPEANRGSTIEQLFAQRQSNTVVEAGGRVTRILRDDDEGSRHQRFIVKLSSGLTVLLSHNIDLAPRVPLSEGHQLEFRGEYEWNERGGVVHWTHHDPGGRRPGGWIRHQGETYR